MYNPRDFATITLPRRPTQTTHFCSNLVWAWPFLLSVPVCGDLCKLLCCSRELLFNLGFSFLPSSHVSHHAHRQDRQPWKAFVCMCVRASVNPFCQVLAQAFLSKLPAWSRSPLCWWEELEEKACGTPAAPRPCPGSSARRGLGLGFGSRRGSVWQLWLTLQSPLPGTPQRNPAFSFTPRKRGEKDNYTHIQRPPSPSRPTVLHLRCMAAYQSYKKTFAKFLVFWTTSKLV